MRQMKSKVIALILVIPLLLMFTTSSVINVTELLVEIPITSIDVLGEKDRVIELSDLLDDSKKEQVKENLKIVAQVTPSEAAKDKRGESKITYRAQEIAGYTLANVLIKDDGQVIPLSTGAVSIIVEGDGRSDLVNMYFTSEIAMSGIEGETFELKEEESLDLSTYFGIDGEWMTENKNIASIHPYSGLVKASLKGETKVIATYDSLSIDKETGEATLKEEKIESIIKVSMQEGLTLSFGGSNQKAISIEGKGSTFLFALEGIDYTKLIVECSSNTIENYSLVKTDDGLIACEFTFVNDVSSIGDLVIIKGENNTNIGVVTVKKKEITNLSANFSADEVIVALKKTNNAKYLVDLELSENTDDYSIRVNSSDITVASFSTSIHDGYISVFVVAYKEGVTELSAQITTKAGQVINVDPMMVNVVAPYEILIIKTETMDIKVKNGSLDTTLALGKYTMNGNINNMLSYAENDTFKISITGVKSDGTTDINEEKISWTSSDLNIGYVDNGQLVFGSESGEVKLTVKNKDEVIGYNPVANITINIRQNGINVDSYSSLMIASRDTRYETVLKADIKIAPDLESRSNDLTFDYKEYANSCTTQMNTTADNTYYKNRNIVTESLIRYAVAFNNNLYGNGYYIDGDNLTSLLSTKYNTRVFRGPLDIVRYSINMGGDENMSIKSQDNAVFIVLVDNITIHNVELKGCSDSSMKDGDSANLSKLDYCGTVLEVVGDNLNLQYSRINNGRTVVRIFGASAEEEGSINQLRIHTNISHCLLRYGREFLLKIGSNKIKKNPSVINAPYLKDGYYVPKNYPDLYNDASPFLYKSNGEAYSITEEKDEFFYNNYVLNDVTVEDSVFMDAGLFSVGLETMFGGLVLHGYDYDSNFAFSELGWSDISGTSYPSILRLKGSVVFYDWKQVGKVDSSTIIEGGSSDIAARIGLNIDISKLINAYSLTESGKDLTVTYLDGQKYVNGAIAYYGGGKNYSYLDLSETGEKFEPLNGYSVPIDYFIEEGREHLINYTAGAEPFRFMLYDRTNSLGVLAQDNAIKDNTAFSSLYRIVR